MTSHSAVITQGGVTSGDTVGIIGLGGLGQIGARIAVAFNKGGTKKDIAGVYEYMASGDLDPTITTIGFNGIPEGSRG